MEKKSIVYIRTAGIYDDSRATKEIASLSRAGYKVLVIGWNKDGKAEEKCNVLYKGMDVRFFFYQKKIEGGIGLKGLPFLLQFMLFAYNTMKKIYGTVDVVHACDLDAGLPAYLFCKKYRLKIVYDIYDYYVDTHFIPRFLRKTVERTEHRIIEFADVTIICTEERKEQIMGTSPKKIVVLHNSPDIAIESLNEEDCVYDYVYCGALSEMRLLERIVSEYDKNQEKRFLFAGSGRLSDLVKEADAKYSNFDCIDAIPYAQVLEYEKKAKVLSAIYEPTIRNHRLCAPNKFYESLALMKPVIVCRGTGIDKIVEENHIGMVIDYDAGQFYEALDYLLENKEIRLVMGEAARKLYDMKYSWTLMEKRLLQMYDDLFKVNI